MLPSLSSTAGRMTRRTAFLVGIVALGALALPTLKWMSRPASTAAAFEDASAGEQAVDKGPAALAEYLPRPSKIEEKIIAALNKPTTVEFTDLPLEDCVAYLKDFHNINIWLDKAALTEEAVALDQPVTLKLADVSLRSVLQLLLEPLQLTYVVENDVMKITPIGHARKKMMTRTYPVGDLNPERLTADEKPAAAETQTKGERPKIQPGDLQRAITKAVDPESWDETKGPASITYVKDSRSLVIRQHWGAHMKIVELLRDLREAKRTPSGDKAGSK